MVMDSHVALRSRPRTSPGLPGPSVCLSTRALPNHPGRLDGCVCSLLPHRWQASSPSEEWPPPLVSRGRIGFAFAGLASSLSRQSPVARPAAVPGRTDSFRAFGCPHTPSRSYMVNEQFTWLTPHSQQDRLGLPGAPKNTKRRRARRLQRPDAARLHATSRRPRRSRRSRWIQTGHRTSHASFDRESDTRHKTTLRIPPFR